VYRATAYVIAAAVAGVLPTALARADILSAKRGFADTGANYGDLQATGAGWYYTWGTGPANPGNFDAKFYPMFWNAPNQTTINSAKARNPLYVLGFNEPERSDQANMTVAQAISSWTTISNSFTGTAAKLVSPAVADTGGSTGGQQWLANFMSQAKAANLKVDAVAFHWYGVSTPDNPAGAASSFLSRVDSYHNSYGLPVFITEFAIHDWGGNYTDAQIIEANRQFLNIVIPGLESRSYVAGYSWYTWFSDAHLFGGTPLTPTPMSYSYIGAVGSGTTADIGGKNLGEHVAYLTGGTLTMTGSPGTARYVNALANTSAITGAIDWGLNAPSNWVRIQGGATLRKTGSNQVTFAGPVTDDGVLEVAQGVLRLGALTTGIGSINISSTGDATGSTARLELAGNITVSPAVFLAQRNDPGGSDGIRNVGGNNTLSGPITITVGGNQARVRSDAGQLTLVGPITTNATTPRNLYLQGAGNGVASGAISDNAAIAGGTINLWKEGAGAWTLAASNTFTGATTINAGRLHVSGSVAGSSGVSVAGGAVFEAAASQRVKSLVIADGGAGEVTSGSPSSSPSVLVTGSLALLGTRSNLDLHRNALVVDYAGGGSSPIADVRDQIVRAYDGGDWNGSGGIGSSDVRAAVQLLSIGYGEASALLGVTGGSFLGTSVDGSAVLVRTTILGDATLDGSVDFADLVVLAQHYDQPGIYADGDLTYDGTVDFGDLVKLAQNYNTALPADPIPGAGMAFEADLTRAFAAVPEPAIAIPLAAASILVVLNARRPRHRPAAT
jgi:autotransporter-associated beta strand protein